MINPFSPEDVYCAECGALKFVEKIEPKDTLDEFWRNFYRSNNFATSDQVCTACGDSGKLRLQDGKDFFCICPNGRGLARSAG
jgi:hypothetical protein